jgi:RNA recognition motif-containing protein
MLEVANSTADNLSRKSSMQRDTQCSSEQDNIYLFPVETFVGGIPWNCSQDQLTQFMSQFGYVKEVYISKDENTANPKGFAYVNFSTVTKMDLLYGDHLWLGKKVQIKRSLQDFINLSDVPIQATESDIASAFISLGYRVREVLIGGKTPGVTPGTVGVRLMKFSFQEKVCKQRFLTILETKVKMMLLRRMIEKTPPKTNKKARSNNVFQSSRSDHYHYSFIIPVSSQAKIGVGRINLDMIDTPAIGEDQSSDFHMSNSALRDKTVLTDSLSLLASIGTEIRSAHSGIGYDTTEPSEDMNFMNETKLSADQVLCLCDQPSKHLNNQVDCYPHMLADSAYSHRKASLQLSNTQNSAQPVLPLEFTGREIWIAYFAFPGHL